MKRATESCWFSLSQCLFYAVRDAVQLRLTSLPGKPKRIQVRIF